MKAPRPPLQLTTGDGFWHHGIRFPRLALQDWAMTFDALGVPWVWLAGVPPVAESPLAPAFYLPASRQYVHYVPCAHEVGEAEAAVLRQFAAAHPPRPHTDDDGVPDLRVAVVDPNGLFRGYSRDGACASTAFDRCRLCGGWWFLDDSQSYRCQCCGAYDGNGHLGASVFAVWPFPAIDAGDVAA